ncbi:MAG: hypothetical protein ACK5MI_02205 [Mangrovibacterium sp.]
MIKISKQIIPAITIAALSVLTSCNTESTPLLAGTDVYQIISTNDETGKLEYQLYAKALTYSAEVDTVTVQYGTPLSSDGHTYPMSEITTNFYYEYLSDKQDYEFGSGTYTFDATLDDGSTLSATDKLTNSKLQPSVIDSCQYSEETIQGGAIKLKFVLDEHADGYNVSVSNADGNTLFYAGPVIVDGDTIALNIPPYYFNANYPQPQDGDELQVRIDALDIQETTTGILDALATTTTNLVWGEE